MRKVSLCLVAGIIFFLSCQSYGQDIKADVQYPMLPVLSQKDINPVMRVDLINRTGENYEIQKIDLELEGDDVSQIVESISIYGAKNNGMINSGKLLSNPLPALQKVSFEDTFTIDTDTFSFWISIKLKEDISLQSRIRVILTEIRTDPEVLRLSEKRPTEKLRVGVAVRQHKQDGVHTSRIPGLETSKNGTLLAIYDARYDSGRDLQGHMDIALNRSTDGGRTWDPMQTVLDMNEWGGLPEKYNGVSDACILVDDNTGDIYVAGLWMHGVLDRETGRWVEGMTEDSTRWIHQWHAKGSQPGFGVKETSQFLITKSSDDGLTWSEPMNITPIKKREWWLFAPAPGHGITLADGTLVLPTQGRDETGKPFSNITWSKDGGKTWTTSNPATKNTTECMAVELSDGSIMLNMRDNRNRGNEEVNGRSVFITNDLGETWVEHHTSRNALIEPTCMASLHKHVYQENGEKKTMLLFVNPASTSKRNNITLKASYDDGNTWPEEKYILLDEYSGRGYSCITSVNDTTIGILYESSQADMVFQTVSLEELK
ncbi:sialidase family protein [Proteiniphilum sp. UBA5384]|uniref:sialidase family protein n=1 Tax=Proteiniphilum sp. UBA5384 TaxID=1947279 RepID=UPI0025F712FD|nr:sialidase family protein [Proteiniphilum sp. UBA5384]